ncbi:hypothetical protein [Methylomonas sp. LWB]|uniref:hypothetical protein n=1 Tax=Methylomonas sp. LWB TaxID=1905845 RepID=UPI000ACC5788|nr:hypothetical protein [Methylomonas sp. LWB]
MKANNTNPLIVGLVMVGLSFTATQAHAASNACIAVNGGFGNGGTTFVGKGFSLPGNGSCGTWSGVVKTGSSVVLTSSGSACTSSDGVILTLTMHSTDPAYFGNGETAAVDHIQLCLKGTTNCPYGQYSHGYFSGPVERINCTTDLITIPSTHD